MVVTLASIGLERRGAVAGQGLHDTRQHSVTASDAFASCLVDHW